MMATSLMHTGTDTAISGRQRRRRNPVRDTAIFRYVIGGSEPNILYEGEPNSLPDFFDVHPQDFSISDQDPNVYMSHDSLIISFPSSETGGVSSLTTSQEQMSWPPVLSSTRRSETEPKALWDHRIGTGGTVLAHWLENDIHRPLFGGPSLAGIRTFESGRYYHGHLDEARGHSERTIAWLMEWLLHARSPVGGETEDTNADQVLATLQASSPEAVERIRKLTNLEPDWDGYGGSPPTEEAVKATAELLLETHKLIQGLPEGPFIAPLPEGGLELEWELDSGAELMLVIPPTGTDVRYLLDEPTSSGDINESEGLVSKDTTLSELINRLTQ